MTPFEETRIGCRRPLQASLDADDILGCLLAAVSSHALGDDIQKAAAPRDHPRLMCPCSPDWRGWEQQARSAEAAGTPPPSVKDLCRSSLMGGDGPFLLDQSKGCLEACIGLQLLLMSVFRSLCAKISAFLGQQSEGAVFGVERAVIPSTCLCAL